MAICILPKDEPRVRFPLPALIFFFCNAYMPLRESHFVKIQVAVPVSHADDLRAALGRAGAGKQGHYEYCSGSWRSIGRFYPLPDAKPAIGEVGTMEEVEEEVIETICHKDIVPAVVAAIRNVHPYEEPPIDIISRLELE